MNRFHSRPWQTVWATLLTVGLCAVQPAIAQESKPTPELDSQAATTPPTELTTLLSELDTAASRQNVKAVSKFYSSAFTHGDGLDLKTWQQALEGFWQKTSDLRYQTQIERWTAKGENSFELETTTQIAGKQQAAGREMNLASTVRSRQTITDGQIVAQDILSEDTRLTLGNTPPDLVVLLPEQVNVNESFNFDVIVKEPLGDKLLLGAALEEPIAASGYLTPASIALEPLTAGGLFKVGQAPAKPTKEWVSAILVQEGGIAIVSRRLTVVGADAGSAAQ